MTYRREEREVTENRDVGVLICDSCGQEELDPYLGLQGRNAVGYWNLAVDGQRFHFDSLECLRQWVMTR